MFKLTKGPMLQGAETSLIARQPAGPQPFTVLILGLSEIGTLENQAKAIGDPVLSRCILKARFMSTQREMQYFSAEEANDVESIGNAMQLAHLILFANYIRKIGNVPHTIDPTRITYQEVALRDFPSTPVTITNLGDSQGEAMHSSHRHPHGLLAYGLDFFRHMEETLIPRTTHNRSHIHRATRATTLAGTRISPSITPPLLASPDQLSLPVSKISFGESLGESYSFSQGTTKVAPPLQPEKKKLLVLENHIPILPRADRENVKRMAQALADQTLTTALRTATEWAMGGNANIRAVEVTYLVNTARRHKNLQLQQFAQYYKILYEARLNMVGNPTLLQITPLSAYANTVAIEQPPTITHTLAGTGNM